MSLHLVPSLSELDLYMTSGDLQRLEEFLHHQCESPLIADILPSIARLYFLSKIPDFKLKPVKAVRVSLFFFFFWCLLLFIIFSIIVIVVFVVIFIVI